MRTPIYKSRPCAPQAAAFAGERINDFIVMSEGWSNSYLIETTQSNILVNTGMGFEAPVHRHNYEQAGANPRDIRFVITTQGHVDHVGGVQYFRDLNPGLVYIAQSNNPEHQAYDARLRDFRARRSAFRFTEQFMQAFADYAEHGYTDINEQDSPRPDILFADQYAIESGALELQLIAVEGAETNDSLIVWLPQHKICFTGNLFGCPFGHFPNLVTIRGDRYRDALTCAKAAQTVMDLEPEVILYGHHSPIVGKDLIAAELTALRDAITYVHDETVRGMNEGKDVHALMQDIQLPEQYEVGQGYGKVSWGVRAIWENYAGWFHHRSTSELYSTPASSVYADLVKLAGPAALLARAYEKFEAGNLEECLHFLDILLSVEGDPDAIELAIKVHEALLLRTDNFWLQGWLENQIKQLRGAVTAPLPVA